MILVVAALAGVGFAMAMMTITSRTPLWQAQQAKSSGDMESVRASSTWAGLRRPRHSPGRPVGVSLDLSGLNIPGAAASLKFVRMDADKLMCGWTPPAAPARPPHTRQRSE